MLDSIFNIDIAIENGYTVYDADAVAAALVTVSKDPNRPIMQGVRFFSQGNTASLESTDVYRLVRIDHQAKAQFPSLDVVLKGDAIAPLVKAAKHGVIAIKKNDDGNTCEVIAASSNRIRSICSIEATNTLRILDGNYPSFASLLDGYTNDETAVPALNSQYFADVCKVAQLATREKGTAIRPLFKGGDVNINPAMFESVNDADGIRVRHLLMPVRI